MRVMVLVKANEESESGATPNDRRLRRDGQVQRGAREGRHHARRRRACMDSSKGKRVRFGGKGQASTVIDGPFAETKELVAGFWIWQVAVDGRGRRVAAPRAVPGHRGRDPAGLRGSRTSGTSSPRNCASRSRRFASRSTRRPPVSDDAEEARRRVEAVWRIEAARLIAGLARTVRDVGLAEDLAQDALVAALEQWPRTGVPDNPGAWLTAVARRRYVDGVRRQVTYERKLDEIGRDQAETEDPMADFEIEPHVEDDVLRLIFTACHPVLPVGRPGRAGAEAGRRADDRGDRPRVPRPDADDGAADRPGQEVAHRGERAVRGAGRRRTGGAAGDGARGRLPRLQRGLHGDVRAVLDPAAAVRGGDAARPDARRARARPAGGARARRADGAAGVPAAVARSTGTASR